MVLNALEHVPKAQVILFDTQSGADVSPDDVYEDTLRNSALIGIAQLSGTFRKSGRPFKVVVGEISEPACYRQIARLVRAREIAKRLRTFNIGLIGHVFRGMFDLEFDRGRGARMPWPGGHHHSGGASGGHLERDTRGRGGRGRRPAHPAVPHAHGQR